MQAQRDINLLSDPSPGRCPTKTGNRRGWSGLAAQESPRAYRMLTRIESRQWHVELLEQAKDHGRCEQVVVEFIFVAVEPGNQGHETALVETVGDVGVKQAIDTAQMSGRQGEDGIQQRWARLGSLGYLYCEVSFSVTEVKLPTVRG